MWKKLDGIGTQPDPASKNAPDLASLGEALVQSLRDDESENDDEGGYAAQKVGKGWRCAIRSTGAEGISLV